MQHARCDAMLRIAFALLLLVHGLIHLLGFARGMGFSSPLTLSISRPVGLLWGISALLFVAAGVLFATQIQSWWVLAAPALVLSQVLIVLSWRDARFGTLPNALILLALVQALASSSPWGFARVYRREVERRVQHAARHDPVRAEELAHLPAAVRRYLELAGVVGRERVRNVRARLRGEIRPSLEASFMPFHAEQHNFISPSARVFFLQSSRSGVPFDALHLYLDDAATMRVKVASLLEIVNARGPEMNQSETVTLFNDLCVLAPATLVDARVIWRELDEKTVHGIFSNAGNTVSATLYFNDAGELVDFVSDDRYLSSDGKTYTKRRWSTPLGKYRDFASGRLASHGAASWHLPSGEFVYVRMDIESVEYNVDGAAR